MNWMNTVTTAREKLTVEVDGWHSSKGCTCAGSASNVYSNFKTQKFQLYYV